eukprot:450766_1
MPIEIIPESVRSTSLKIYNLSVIQSFGIGSLIENSRLQIMSGIKFEAIEQASSTQDTRTTANCLIKSEFVGKPKQSSILSTSSEFPTQETDIKAHSVASSSSRQVIQGSTDQKASLSNCHNTMETHLSTTINQSCRCGVCSKVFEIKSDLVNHSCFRTKSSKCKLCPKKFENKSKLNNHMYFVHSGIVWACDKCEKVFSVKGSLTNHKRKFHVGPKRSHPYSCELCPQRFREASIATDHLMHNHYGIRPFSCQKCPKRFTKKVKLDIHLRTHTGIKPFTCTICKKSFSQKSRLTSHMSIHSGVKPHSCEVCKRKFRLKEHVKRHMAVHSSAKIHSCEICQRGFKRKYALKRHHRIHKVVPTIEALM